MNLGRSYFRRFFAYMYVGFSVLAAAAVIFAADTMLRFLNSRGEPGLGTAIFILLFVLALLLPISASYIVVVRGQREGST